MATNDLKYWYEGLSFEALGASRDQKHWYEGLVYAPLTFEGVLELTAQVSDTLSFTDEAENSIVNEVDVADTLAFTDELAILLASPVLPQTAEETFAFTDSVETYYGIYTEEMSFAFADTLEIGEEQLIVQNIDDYGLQIFEGLLLQDESYASEIQPLDTSEVVDITDAVEVFLTGALEQYDTLQYNWLDEVTMSLEQGISVEDTFAFTDESAVSLIISVLNTSASETLSLTDAVETALLGKMAFEENFTISDSLQTFMSIALEIEDTLALLDAAISGGNVFGDFSDTLSFTDAISGDLVSQIVVDLTASVSDSFTLSDSVVKNKPYNMSDYLRRYLNDRELV